MATASTIGSGGSGRFDAFQPIICAPTEGTVVIEIPPREPICDLRTADDPEYCTVFQHLYRLVTPTGAAAQAKTEPSGVFHSDVVSHGCGIGSGLHDILRLDGRKQDWIQADSTEVLLAEGTELDQCPRRCVEVPLYACTSEVLRDHAWLDSEFGHRGAEAFGTAMIHIETEEAETDIMASFVVVLAKSISDQGRRRRSGSGRTIAKEFGQRSESYLALLAWFHGALHSGAPEVLNQESSVLECLSDGRTPDLKATGCFENGLKGLVQVVTCLGEVLA